MYYLMLETWVLRGLRKIKGSGCNYLHPYLARSICIFAKIIVCCSEREFKALSFNVARYVQLYLSHRFPPSAHQDSNPLHILRPCDPANL